MITLPAWIESALSRLTRGFSGRIEMNVHEDGIADLFLWRKDRHTSTYTGERITPR